LYQHSGIRNFTSGLINVPYRRWIMVLGAYGPTQVTVLNSQGGEIGTLTLSQKGIIHKSFHGPGRFRFRALGNDKWVVGIPSAAQLNERNPIPKTRT
jgi:hypothetical protein